MKTLVKLIFESYPEEFIIIGDLTNVSSIS